MQQSSAFTCGWKALGAGTEQGWEAPGAGTKQGWEAPGAEMASQPRRMLLRPLSLPGSAPVPLANAAMFNQVQRSRVSPGSLSQGCLSLRFIPCSGIQLECWPSVVCLRHPGPHPPPFPKKWSFPTSCAQPCGVFSSEVAGAVKWEFQVMSCSQRISEHLLRAEGRADPCSHHCSSFPLLVSSFFLLEFFLAFSKP